MSENNNEEREMSYLNFVNSWANVEQIDGIDDDVASPADSPVKKKVRRSLGKQMDEVADIPLSAAEPSKIADKSSEVAADIKKEEQSKVTTNVSLHAAEQLKTTNDLFKAAADLKKIREQPSNVADVPAKVAEQSKIADKSSEVAADIKKEEPEEQSKGTRNVSLHAAEQLKTTNDSNVADAPAKVAEQSKTTEKSSKEAEHHDVEEQVVRKIKTPERKAGKEKQIVKL